LEREEMDITDTDAKGTIGESTWMPRTARSIEAGMVDHVLNRGNGRLRLFQKEGDYDALAWRGLAWRGQTEFQVNLKLGLTPRSR